MAAEINITSSNDDENDKLNSELDRATKNNDELEKRLTKAEKENKDLENQVKRQNTRFKGPAKKEVSRFKKPNRDKPPKVNKPAPTTEDAPLTPEELSKSRDKLNKIVDERFNAAMGESLSIDDVMDGIVNDSGISLTDDQLAALNKAAGGKKGNLTDALLEARIENLYRTLSTDKFKEQFVTQDPFFQKLGRKAESAMTPEELNTLSENEQNKQLSSIAQFDTKLSNALNLIRATIDARIEDMESREEPDLERISKYEDFRANVNDIQSQVNEFVQQATDTVKEKTYTTARQGFDTGVKDREAKELEQQLKEAEKRGKQADKIIEEFDKEFKKYMDAQRKELANETAFAFGQQAIKEGKSKSEAKLIYQNAKTFFEKNIQTPNYTFTPEEIEAAYAASGGTFKDFDFKNSKKVPKPTMPPGFSPPPQGAPPNTPPGSQQGTSQFGPGSQQNASNLVTPPSIPNVVSPTDISNTIRLLLLPLRDLVTEPMLQASRLGVKSTSAERAKPGDVSNAAAAAGRPYLDFAGSVTGAAMGAAGGIAGIAGGPIGMIAGAAIGEQIAELIPMEQYAEMIGLLYEINANIAKNSEAFSADLLITKVDQQVALLEQNINVGQTYGAEIAEVQASQNELSLLLYQEFVDIALMLKPTMLTMLTIMKTAVESLSLMVIMSKNFINSMFPIFSTLGYAADWFLAKEKSKPSGKRSLDFNREANENIPFDIG